MNFPSRLMEDAVNAFATLPGIGKKTALRLVLHVLKQSPEKVDAFGEAIIKMRHDIQFCQTCHNVSDESVCSICSSPRRDQAIICVVEGLRDVMAIESTQQYNGTYHVLGGVISPIEGIGPDVLNIDTLLLRVKKGDIKEVILAISPTIEGDTTMFYITKQLRESGLAPSTLARGIAFGGELEYADEVTLGRAIASRRPYEMD